MANIFLFLGTLIFCGACTTRQAERVHDIGVKVIDKEITKLKKKIGVEEDDQEKSR